MLARNQATPEEIDHYNELQSQNNYNYSLKEMLEQNQATPEEIDRYNELQEQHYEIIKEFLLKSRENQYSPKNIRKKSNYTKKKSRFDATKKSTSKTDRI